MKISKAEAQHGKLVSTAHGVFRESFSRVVALKG